MNNHLTTWLLDTISSLTGTAVLAIWKCRKRIYGAALAAIRAIDIRRSLRRPEPIPVIRLGVRRGMSAVLATAATLGGVGGAFSFLYLITLSSAWVRFTLTTTQRGGLILCTAMLMVACWLCWSAAEGAWRDGMAGVR